MGPGAEIAERSFVLTVASPELFVSQLEHRNPPFIMGAQTLGERWLEARADLLDVVTAAGETNQDTYQAKVSYLVTTVPAA